MSDRPESSNDQDPRGHPTHDGMSRRNILLAGTVFAAASTAGSTD